MLEVLDQEYDSDREAATAVFNAVVELLAQRKSLVVGVKTSLDDEMTLIYAPFWDLRSARAFSEKVAGTGLRARIANAYRPVAPLEPEPSGWCPECCHPLHVHEEATKGRRRACFAKGCQPCAPKWPKPRARRGGG